MKINNRLIWSLSIILLGVSVFLIQMTFASKLHYAYRFGLILILVVSSIFLLNRTSSKEAGKMFYLYFAAAASIMVSHLTGHWGLLLFGLDTSSYIGIAVAKFSESLPIVVSIIILIKIIGINTDSLYLAKGKLKSGLIIGLSFFLVFTLLTILMGGINPLFQDKLNNSEISNLAKILPWALLFSLTNGFMEELLFRGLFLKLLETKIGFKLSNILTAAIFAFAHLQVTYVTHTIGFLIVVFLLGLLLGSIMKKTNSIIAPTLIHAGADMMMILPMFMKLA
jgi:uncharacterized protein